MISYQEESSAGLSAIHADLCLH